MTDSPTEARLREAMQAIRRQSVAAHQDAPPLDDRLDADLLDLESGPRSPARRHRWLPATAAALLVVVLGLVAVASGIDDRESNVTAARPDQAAARRAAIAQVVEGCGRYQAARPAEPAPVDGATELTRWLDQYDAAIAAALANLREVPAAAEEDRAVLGEAEDALVRQGRALDAARVAASSGDTVEAVRLIDQARSYESIAAFELAQWGAVECDARGVTQPTR